MNMQLRLIKFRVIASYSRRFEGHKLIRPETSMDAVRITYNAAETVR